MDARTTAIGAGRQRKGISLANMTLSLSHRDQKFPFPNQAAPAPGEHAGHNHGTMPDGVLTGFITPMQLAAQLDVSVRTLSRWQTHRIGPPRCTVGRLIVYPIDAVRNWLLANGASAPHALRPVPAKRAGEQPQRAL
jgi:hypothetical protein